jgi:acetyl esterase/lipase
MISKEAKNIEYVLRKLKLRDRISKMILAPKRNTRYKLPPKRMMKRYDVEHITIDGWDCFSLQSGPNPTKNIIYFHGGAYAMEAQKVQWDIVNNILSEADCMVTFVDYPLAPEYTCVDTINMVKNTYRHFCKETKQEIILMGDSAGGGLALALAQIIKMESGIMNPSKIILLSPWLDISMTDNISVDQENNDVMMDRQTLRVAGEKYIGELSPKNPLCSPIYGNVLDMGSIVIFTGTSEILNPQAKILKEKIENSNGKIVYHEYKGMQHMWLAYPIPEARDAMKKVCRLIMED